MHNIRTNFGRFYRICKQFFESETDSSGNFQYYPQKPALSDVQVVALSCTMEALGIDSENLLWSKLWDRLCITLPAPDLPYPLQPKKAAVAAPHRSGASKGGGASGGRE